ncbi:Flp pilus assembly complex ATPase component TadA [Kordiimonas sp. SCSIO 12603]|uniref:GspE/PulE family protein n=1 Tax=Kordiimonas sp. SCSIO 12603 TaxID=2829596 RepID=UPI002106D861|nr:ATPase, T2SS/T4P/T4SS family [Kordiimonas sp. SCSIO 12603]UTW58740.1 Flp pilus assembly complex ATPase component TadA [Kordiimonas sp. SCSIO 12603]
MGAYQDFGEALVAQQQLSAASWARVLDVLSEARQSFAETLAGLGLFSEEALAEKFSVHFGLPLAEDIDFPHEPVDIPGLNTTFLNSSKILPVYDHGDTLAVLMADPTDDFARKGLEFAAGKPINIKITTLRKLEAAINRLYMGGDSSFDDETDLLAISEDVDRLKELATDAPVIRFVDRLIDDALHRRASDIHVEPIDGILQIRLRVDGMLKEVQSPSRDISAAVVSRLKIMSGLDIAERRLPQDGRMRVRAHGKEIDFRVSTAPTAQGEAVVLRLLDRGAVVLDFDALGFDEKVREPFRSAVKKPDGIVLVTGPTGSGKTTTLYTGLSELNEPERKILTVEDPVEYVLNGLGQVQVDARIGRTFANTLRAFLRQDPDVIMVGEIRDEETASIAIQASLTGHLVLSTLHTNSAAAAITRLLDMGVEDYLIASTVRLVMAQRLIRTLCRECVEEDNVPDAVLEDIGLTQADGPFHTAKGCEVCHQSGYAGRTMIAEVFELGKDIERAILERKSGTELEEIAKAGGMRDLFAHGLEKVRAGETSLTEVLRVTRERG